MHASSVSRKLPLPSPPCAQVSRAWRAFDSGDSTSLRSLFQRCVARIWEVALLFRALLTVRARVNADRVALLQEYYRCKMARAAFLNHCAMRERHHALVKAAPALFTDCPDAELDLAALPEGPLPINPRIPSSVTPDSPGSLTLTLPMLNSNLPTPTAATTPTIFEAPSSRRSFVLSVPPRRFGGADVDVDTVPSPASQQRLLAPTHAPSNASRDVPTASTAVSETPGDVLARLAVYTRRVHKRLHLAKEQCARMDTFVRLFFAMAGHSTEHAPGVALLQATYLVTARRRITDAARLLASEAVAGGEGLSWDMRPLLRCLTLAVQTRQGMEIAVGRAGKGAEGRAPRGDEQQQAAETSGVRGAHLFTSPRCSHFCGRFWPGSCPGCGHCMSSNSARRKKLEPMSYKRPAKCSTSFSHRRPRKSLPSLSPTSRLAPASSGRKRQRPSARPW